MKNLRLFGTLVSGDFEENTMTFEIDSEMVLQAGKYVIHTEDDYNILVNAVDGNQKELFTQHLIEIISRLPSDEEIEVKANNWVDLDDYPAEIWRNPYEKEKHCFMTAAKWMREMIIGNGKSVE